MDNYLRKYMDPPKKGGAQVVYRNQVEIVDKDNIDWQMGRLVDQEEEDDFKPVLVETKESKKISALEKERALETLTKQIREKDRSRSRDNSGDDSSSISSDDDSDSDSDSKEEPQREVQRQAPTVYRDQQGNRISLEQKQKEEQDKKIQRRIDQGKTVINEKAVEANKAIMGLWAKGMVQQQQKEQQENLTIPEDEQRANDLRLIREEKFADPMRKIIQAEEQALLQTKTVVKRCQFPTIPNRYGIEAGHLWDGVDRGNGYEKKHLSRINERKELSTRQALEHQKQL